MRIRKISQSAAIPGKIVNSPSDSTTETYSCNYINDVSVVVSPTEPTGNNKNKVWFKKGKNLFNGLEVGGIGPTGALENNNARLRSKNAINVNPSTDYTISVEEYNTSKGNPKVNVIFYDKNNNFISFSGWKDNNYTFTTPNNCNYVRLLFYFSNSTSQTLVVSDITESQLEQGATVTEYEEYVEHKIYVKNDNGVYEELMKKEENTDWMELVTGISYRKIGADVELNIKYIQNIAMANNTWVTIATLPVGYRPKLNIYIPVMIMNTSNVLVYSILAIDPDGKLSFKQATGNNITGTDCRAFSRFSTL